MHEWSIFYGLATGSVFFLVCWAVMIVSMLLIQRFIASEKRKERKAMRGANGGGFGGHNHQRFSTNTAFFFANAHLWNELRNVMLVLCLLVVYLLFIGPYVVRTKYDQIKQVGGGRVRLCVLNCVCVVYR